MPLNPAHSPGPPGARPRLLAVLVTILAAVVLLPWLSGVQWRGQGVQVVRAVTEGRPFSSPERAGYIILGMAADTIMPSAASRDLNLLGLAAGILATLAVARCRSALARGGAPIDRLLEPVAAALALLACGPFLLRAPSADVAGVEVAMVATAAALAWTGRPAAGLALFGALLFVSSRALLSLPMLLAAPRLRGDLRMGLPALVPWAAYAVFVRPGLVTTGDPGYAPEAAAEALMLAVGVGGVALMALPGALLGIARGGPHRRFAYGVAATLLLVAVFYAPRAGWAESAVVLAPWLAVLAGSGVASLRRAAARVARVSLGPAGAGLGLVVLVVGLFLAVRHQVAPTWRQAEEFPVFCRDLNAALANPSDFVASWDDVELYGLALDRRPRAWRPLPGLTPPDRPLTAEERAILDAQLEEGSVVLLRRTRYASVLTRDAGGVAQFLKPEDAPILGLIASFGRELVLEQADVVLAPGRRPGGLVTLRLHWRAGWDGGQPPLAPNGVDHARSLRAVLHVVDSGGHVRLDLTHWLAHGLMELPALGGRGFNEIIIFRMPEDCGPGDYGIEVALYEPKPGESTALAMELKGWRQDRYQVHTGINPPGVTPQSVRAASFRLQPPASGSPP